MNYGELNQRIEFKQQLNLNNINGGKSYEDILENK